MARKKQTVEQPILEEEKPDTLLVPNLSWRDLSNVLSTAAHNLQEDFSSYDCESAAEDLVLVARLKGAISEMRTAGFSKLMITFTDMPEH